MGMVTWIQCPSPGVDCRRNESLSVVIGSFSSKFRPMSFEMERLLSRRNDCCQLQIGVESWVVLAPFLAKRMLLLKH